MADKHMYRVSKFVVPASARGEFLHRSQESRERLRTVLGFVQDMVLEKTTGPGEFNIITITEWESTEVVQQAEAAMQALYQETKFNPQDMYARLGITLDRADYVQMEG